MRQLLFEYLFGGILILISIRSTFSSITKIIEYLLPEKFTIAGIDFQRSKIIKFTVNGTRILLAFLAANLLLDPLIPGQGTIHVYAPSEYPTVQENLQVTIGPIKSNGKVDPTRIFHGRFDLSGVRTKILKFNLFENRLYVKVYDITEPQKPIVVGTRRVSAYVRQGLWDKHIRF